MRTSQTLPASNQKFNEVLLSPLVPNVLPEIEGTATVTVNFCQLVVNECVVTPNAPTPKLGEPPVPKSCSNSVAISKATAAFAQKDKVTVLPANLVTSYSMCFNKTTLPAAATEETTFLQ